MRPLLIVIALVAFDHSHALAQSAPAPLARAATVTGGVGNAMGWLGVQGERYLHRERLSLFAGIGYLPEGESGDTSGVAFAGGLRVFTTKPRHRAFLEGSVSLVAIRLACFEQCERYYGPGVQVGYQFVSRRGLTVLASIGGGYAPGAPDGGEVAGLFGLGVGYTWRRASP
jgi:hypothetical protein